MAEGKVEASLGRGFLRAENFRRLLDQGRGSLRSIELSSFGEPFLNPHLLEIFCIAHRGERTVTPVSGVDLLGRAVDRASQRTDAVFHQPFQHLGARIVQIDAPQSLSGILAARCWLDDKSLSVFTDDGVFTRQLKLARNSHGLIAAIFEKLERAYATLPKAICFVSTCASEDVPRGRHRFRQ